MRQILMYLLLSSYFIISLSMERPSNFLQDSSPQIIFKKYTREKTQSHTDTNAVHRNCYRKIAYTYLLQFCSLLETPAAKNTVEVPFLDIYAGSYKNDFFVQKQMLLSGFPAVNIENLVTLGSPCAWGHTTDGSPFIVAAFRASNSLQVQVNSIVYNNKFLWNSSTFETPSGIWQSVKLENYFARLDSNTTLLSMLLLIKNKKLLISRDNQAIELRLDIF